MTIYGYQHGFRDGISRRRFLLGAAAALGGIALPSCSGAGAAGSAGAGERLDYWNFYTGGDGERMIDMLADYERSHPRVDFQSTTLAWGQPYYTKLAMALSSDSAPDVAALHLTRLPAYAPAGLLEPLDPDMLSEYGMGPDKFLPEVLESATYNGKLYAIPLDTHPFVMYYNTEVCGEAGLLDAEGNLEPLEGPDQVLGAFQKAQEVTGALGLSMLTNDDAGPWRLFWSLYKQLGGQLLSPDAKEVVLDREKAARTVEFMTELTQGTGVAAADLNSDAAVAEFQSERAGFLWNGEWEVATFELADIPFSMVPFPEIFGGGVTQADRHSFVLPRGIDRERMDVALKFVKAMLEDSLTWARTGHVPAYLPTTEGERYQRLKPQSNYAGVADNAVLDPPAWFSGSGSNLQRQISAALESAMSGQASPGQAVTRIRRVTEELVATPAPV